MKNAVKLRVGNQNYLIGYFNAFMNSGPPEFGRSVNPIQTMGVGWGGGADYAHHTTCCQSPGSKMPSTTLPLE